MPSGELCYVFRQYIAGISLRARGRGFSPATMSMSTGFLYRKQRKIKPKEHPSCTIPLLLIAFPWQLEMLVTALVHWATPLLNRTPLLKGWFFLRGVGGGGRPSKKMLKGVQSSSKGTELNRQVYFDLF